MRAIPIAFAAFALLATAGCSTTGNGGGSLLALGAFPSRTSSDAPAAEALIAALNGGIIDENVNARLDRTTRKMALQAEYRALEYTPAGEAVDWDSEGTAVHGEVVASQPYRVGSQDCRHYTHTVSIGGDPAAKGQGTACRNGDGSWTPLT